MTDRRPANGRVKRASGPVRVLRGRGFSFRAGTPRGVGHEDALIRGRLARTLAGGYAGLPGGQQLDGQGVPRSAQQGRPTHNASEVAWARRAWGGYAGQWAGPHQARSKDTGRAAARPCFRGVSLALGSLLTRVTGSTLF